MLGVPKFVIGISHFFRFAGKNAGPGHGSHIADRTSGNNSE